MTYQFAIAGEKPVDLNAIVATLRKQAAKNKPQLAKQSVGTQASVTESVVVVLGAEDPHTHPANDLIIYVLEGGGCVQLFPGKIEAPQSSVVVIPKGVCHAFHNTSANGSVVIATFSPAKVEPAGKCIEQ
jgi:quercetin dioxygenase-like cupin family protein